MTVKTSTAAAKTPLTADKAVDVMTTIMAETPELANPLIARNVIQKADDGTITVSGTTETIHNIGEYVMSFTAATNTFLGALVNRIGFVYISSKMYTNPWAVFKKGRLEFGETVEEIFVNLAKPYQYSPSKAETTLYAREIPDVRTAFHTMNFQKYYPVTVSDDQLRQAFLTWQGIADLIAKIVESVFAAAQTDEYLVMKYMLARSIVNGFIQGQTIQQPTKANMVDVATTIRETAMNLEYQSTNYTFGGVTTHTPIEDQYLITTTAFRASMDMNVLASAFNLDYARFMGNVINVDSFVNMDWERLEDLFTDENGDVDPGYAEWTEDEIEVLEGVPAITVSKEFWQVWDNFEKMTEAYNGRGLYWNYFYHVWKTFSVSPFSQAVAYSAVAASITSVTVSPTTATLPKGADLQLSAAVESTGVINQGVQWTVTGNASSGTAVTSAGKLHVAKDETASTLTVTATSIADPTKHSDAAITVSQD